MTKSLQENRQKKQEKQKNKRLALMLTAGVIFMFGFCYMLVPLYNFVCKKEGINGKSVLTPSILMPGMAVDTSRTIKVEFTTTLHGGLAFKFEPVDHRITLHPGETKLIYFYAENQTGNEMTVQAVPSVTPTDAARFLKKTECFCFTQQYFFKNEKAKMPVFFYLDPSVPKEIKEVTLSYTLFDARAYLKEGQKHFTKGRIDL